MHSDISVATCPFGTGPCVGCGEENHTAHHVSICATCRRWLGGERGGAHAETHAETHAEGRCCTPRKLDWAEGRVALVLTVEQAAFALERLRRADDDKEQ